MLRFIVVLISPDHDEPARERGALDAQAHEVEAPRHRSTLGVPEIPRDRMVTRTQPISSQPPDQSPVDVVHAEGHLRGVRHAKLEDRPVPSRVWGCGCKIDRTWQRAAAHRGWPPRG